VRTAFLAALIVVSAAACQRAAVDEPAPDTAAPAALESFRVRGDDPNLVFQYADPASGGLKVARRAADVPEAVRGNVFVTSTAFRKGDVPANLVIVANLEKAEADGTYPFRLVSRYDRVRPAGRQAATPEGPDTASAPATDKVLLFSTSWCPHCRTARQWLESNGVPFEEKDVEGDPAAQRLLAELGRKQGIPDHMLSSVPILYARGQLILGFNQAELARLLGK